MARWLLNTFPTWVLAMMIVAVFVVLALAGLRLVRRMLPDQSARDANDFTGVMASVIAAVYGVFLAFAIVALYEEFHEANQDVNSEAVTLAQIVRNGDALRAPEAARLRAAVRGYRDAVVGPEWKAMEDGEQSDVAGRRLDELFGAVRSYEPRGDRENTFHGKVVDAVNDLVGARRARLHAAEATLPGTLWILLVGGAVLTLAFSLAFGVPNPSLHTSMGVSLAVLLAFCLVVALALDHPFSGDLRVSADEYSAGALSGL